MPHAITRAIFEVLAVGLLLVCASSARTAGSVRPEIDLRYEFNAHARLLCRQKDDRDSGDPPQATVGPSIMLYRKPLLRLKQLLASDLDTTKSRLILMETGYRIITAPDAAVENRVLKAATFDYPMLHQFLITDRNRFDLDWQKGYFFSNRLASRVQCVLRA
jgi:hypothetical protein